MNRNLPSVTLVTAIALACAGLSGCDNRPQSGPTIGQKVDKAVDNTNEALKSAGDKIDEAARNVKESAQSAGEKLEQQGAKAAAAIEDSAITTAVKAELVKEPSVSAFKINVETAKGEVTLNGEVANQAAREAAERVAKSVKGVTKVNNQLRIVPAATTAPKPRSANV